ncbi:MAG: alcohol dehydrogenase catalytic domain-containing protein [Planctomycetota bacterium]|nr:alcohol dehydrogenase catalytic domain-containing protein [Planctomycetota bacterium]
MQALVLSAPRTLKLETLPDPTPGPGEAVVEVSYAGICGTDVELFINDLSHYTLGYAKLPIVPGHEWSGTVVAVGAGVNRLKPGERVIAEVAIGCGTCRFCRKGYQNVCADRREVGIVNQDGGFAQFAKVPARNLRRAGDLPPDAAALSEPTAVALNACKVVELACPDRVLVVGAGPVGLLALQCARACGAGEVTVLDRAPARLEAARKLGAAHVMDGSSFAPAELPERAKALTRGEGFDVILECAGAGALFGDLLPSLARLGRLAVVGCFQEQRPAINPDWLVGGQRRIAGAVGGGSYYAEAVDLLRSGRVQAPPLISHRLPLREGPALLERLAARSGPDGALKVLLQP